MAHLPDKVIVSLCAEPLFQDAADAESAELCLEESPRAFQPKPELHETFLVVFYMNHLFSFIRVNSCNLCSLFL
jgi:hypothetical protein